LEDALVDWTNAEVADIDGSKVKVYLAKFVVPVTSGQVAQQSTVVGSPGRTPRVEIRSPNVTEVMSVVDSAGNEWTQVDSLTTDSVYRSISNAGSTSSQVSSIMKPEPVIRRFVVKRMRGKTFLEFAPKSDANLKSNVVADPSNVVIKMSGKSTVDALKSIDPTKLVSSDKFGVAPVNTTLTITYKYNQRNNVNIAVGSLNQVLSAGISFKDEHLLSPSYLKYIKENVAVRNDNPINGDVSMLTTDEIKHPHQGSFSAKKRAVTLQDYKTAAYAMPSRWGKIKRATVLRDNNDFRRNLNMYIIAEGADGKLQAPNTELYKNLKFWLNSRRMISDSIDVFPAYIANFGIEYDIVAEGNMSRERLMGPIREELYNELTRTTPEIGEDFNIAKVWAFIQNYPGVSSVRSVRLVSKVGEGYAGNLYQMRGKLRPMESLRIDNNYIWEIKNPTDISMRQFNGRIN